MLLCALLNCVCGICPLFFIKQCHIFNKIKVYMFTCVQSLHVFHFIHKPEKHSDSHNISSLNSFEALYTPVYQQVIFFNVFFAAVSSACFSSLSPGLLLSSSSPWGHCAEAVWLFFPTLSKRKNSFGWFWQKGNKIPESAFVIYGKGKKQSRNSGDFRSLCFMWCRSTTAVCIDNVCMIHLKLYCKCLRW